MHPVVTLHPLSDRMNRDRKILIDGFGVSLCRWFCVGLGAGFVCNCGLLLGFVCVGGFVLLWGLVLYVIVGWFGGLFV